MNRTKKLSDGVLIVLDLETPFHRYVPVKGPDGRTRLVRADTPKR
jgi:hypothetical protein